MKTLQILPASGAHWAKYAHSSSPRPLIIVAWEVLIEEGKYTITGLVPQNTEIVRATDIEGFSGYGSY